MTHDTDDDEDDFYASGNVRDGDYEVRSIGDNSGDEDLEALDLEDLMKEGRMLLLRNLVKLVRNGQATPQEQNVLRQLLKDNGMIAGDPLEGASSEERRPAKRDLPTFDDPEYR